MEKESAEVSYGSSLEIFISHFGFIQHCSSKKKKENAGEEELASVPDKKQNMLQKETDNFEKYSPRN